MARCTTSLMSPWCTSFGSPAKSHRYSPCRASDDYYIKDYGIILVPEVTQRRTDNNDHSPSSG
jgi:hypothetical protein